MNDFDVAKVMLKKLKPMMFNQNWIEAVQVLNKLDKKGVKDRDSKEKFFIYLVDKIYSELDG